MKYRLIAIDIDGTLVNSHGQVTNRTKEAVHRVAQMGATVVVATGRRFSTAKPRVMQLELPEVLIAGHNGAILKRLNGELLHHQLLSQNVAHKVAEVAKALELCPIVFAGTQNEANMFVEDYGDRIDDWQRGYLQENQPYVHWVEDLSTDLPDNVIEVICVVPAAEVDQINRAFQQHLDGQVKSILVTTADRQRAFLGFSHPKVGKCAPLRYLAERMGLDQAQVLAIGDNYNDIDMLQFAGTGVVMENAEIALKGMGFHVTDSNDADGVALALEKFVFKAD